MGIVKIIVGTLLCAALIAFIGYKVCNNAIKKSINGVREYRTISILCISLFAYFTSYTCLSIIGLTPTLVEIEINSGYTWWGEAVRAIIRFAKCALPPVFGTMAAEDLARANVCNRIVFYILCGVIIIMNLPYCTSLIYIGLTLAVGFGAITASRKIPNKK